MGIQLTVYEQTGIFLWSFVLGAVIAAIYIAMSAWRILTPLSKATIFITDFLFMICSALLNFLFALTVTNGKIRGYVLLAELISFLVLYLTLGRLICKSVYVIRDVLKKAFKKMVYPLTVFREKIKEAVTKKLMKNGKKT